MCLPKTLHDELDALARNEGISLNQYIIYTLTQKVTAEKLGGESQSLTSAQTRFLAQVKSISPEQAAEQKAAFDALLAKLGPAATDEEVARFLSEREVTGPEPALAPEAVTRLKERIAQIR